MPSITHEEAIAALQAAIGRADELGVKVGIAIVDEAGQAVASVRMAGVAFQWLNEAAQGKAMATIFWRGEPSGTLQERANSPLLTWLNDNYHGKLVYMKGAVPIRRGGELIGAIGAGGASPDDDEDIARAGAAVLEA